ncbi:ATP-binding cassette domain-containing protein [Alicyclobacillus kakegawensis]|uniref:ATP-binding cassette domain-containing protein n=1 Tax=Alicyclobacillus kakegawensis TaxID=392012 RepID=UPI0009F95506|nr:ATP-binding cassette domain-containing protein [Alicyclobacillus kakegawensis]
MTVELCNVSYRYKRSNRLVLDSISLSFKEEKLNVIVGLNGAGKTTLFDLMSIRTPV